MFENYDLNALLTSILAVPHPHVFVYNMSKSKAFIAEEIASLEELYLLSVGLRGINYDMYKYSVWA